MSRVLARPMFRKNAPKRSAKGSGITSMFEDDVPGYAEGGEVDSERSQRERAARELLDRGREEYQRFSEGERPQMTRPPATVGAPPQVSPQQMQAMQIQQLAQMGMLPRFQEGGIVTAPMRNPNFQNPLAAGSPAAASAAAREAERARLLSAGSPTVPQQVYSDVTATPEYAEASRLMDEGRITNNRDLYMQGLQAIRRMTEGSYLSKGEAPSPPAEDSSTLRELSGKGPSPFRISDLPSSPTPEAGPLAEMREPAYRPAPVEEEAPAPPPRPEGLTLESSRRAAGAARGMPSAVREPPSKTTELEDIKNARKENAWMALMQAGLAIAGGQSPNALTNIAQGAQTGLGAFMSLEQQRRQAEDAAARRAFQERQLAMQAAQQAQTMSLKSRELEMRAPLLQAQTEAYRARPQAASSALDRARYAAEARALEQAQKLWTEERKLPQYLAMSNNPMALATAEAAFIRRKVDALLPSYVKAAISGGGSSSDPAGLGLSGDFGEE